MATGQGLPYGHSCANRKTGTLRALHCFRLLRDSESGSLEKAILSATRCALKTCELVGFEVLTRTQWAGRLPGGPALQILTVLLHPLVVWCRYDLDVLEIRFFELDYAVDFFVVLEAPHHTTGLFEKPLLFKQNRHRFSRFLHKIIYFEMPRSVSEFFASYCAERFLR